MKSAIIIDDEFGARKTLKNLIALHCPEVKIIGEADSISSGIDLLKRSEADILFLDIRIHQDTGFDLLDHFPAPPFKVIFTTAYDQFALKAFQYHATAYLLKPIAPTELVDAVARISDTAISPKHTLKSIHNLIHDLKTKKFEKITLSTIEGLIILPLDQIIRLESSGNYTTFHTMDNEKIMIAKTIKEYEKILPENIFRRIHRSHIINVNHIKGIMKEEGGYLLSVDNARLPIARRKRDALIEYLKSSSI